MKSAIQIKVWLIETELFISPSILDGDLPSESSAERWNQISDVRRCMSITVNVTRSPRDGREDSNWTWPQAVYISVNKAASTADYCAVASAHGFYSNQVTQVHVQCHQFPAVTWFLSCMRVTCSARGRIEPCVSSSDSAFGADADLWPFWRGEGFRTSHTYCIQG